LIVSVSGSGQVAAGATETYELRGNFTIAAAGVAGTALGNISVKIADLSTSSITNTFDNVAAANDANSITSAASSIPTLSFVWSDRSVAVHTTATSDWANDYKISGIPTNTLTLSK